MYRSYILVSIVTFIMCASSFVQAGTQTHKDRHTVIRMNLIANHLHALRHGGAVRAIKPSTDNYSLPNKDKSEQLAADPVRRRVLVTAQTGIRGGRRPHQHLRRILRNHVLKCVNIIDVHYQLSPYYYWETTKKHCIKHHHRTNNI